MITRIAKGLGPHHASRDIDRKGRRTGLIVTLGLMAVGTFTIALTPGYNTIGLAAPLLVLCGRLIQGFSAGVELGGVSVYLAGSPPRAIAGSTAPGSRRASRSP